MFVAWRDLKFAKGRFALMGAVIVLITLLVGLLPGLTAGLGQQNISAITGLPADRIAFQAPGDGQDLPYSDSTVTRPQWQRWSTAPGVQSAEPLGITTTRATTGDGSTAVSAFGVEPGSRLAPGSDKITDSAVVLSAAAADTLGVEAGGSLTLAGRRLTVAAVAGGAFFSHTPVIWTSLDTWRRTAPPTGAAGEPTATVIALNTTSGADIQTLDQQLGTRTVSTGDSLPAIGSYASENGSLQLMRGFLFAISAVPFPLTPATVLFPAAVIIALGALGAALSIRRITSVDPLTALGSA
ncbi:ABC transporter permease [Planomonospora corallina]|uniref:ABC transporter permease n=1 Tax=Planomonospora corallina TaxID=1806052 RepID=A0ABV8IGS4_9ACTN